MYPVELEMKDTTESNPSVFYFDLLLSIYLSRETISCTLPFKTNETSSTSMSKAFRSWVTVFLLYQPMAFLSHSSYDMLGLAPLMNVLFWGRCDLQIIFLGSDMSGDVLNCLLWCFILISLYNMKSLSPQCYMTFWGMIIYSDILHWSVFRKKCERPVGMLFLWT